MSAMTLQDLHTLLSYQGNTCVSIFLPTHRQNVVGQNDAIVLKNLSLEAERQLIDGGMREVSVRDLMAPVKAHVADQLFWTEQDVGLAIFRAGDLFYTWRLHHAPPPCVYVGERFYTRHLLPALWNSRAFHVLAVSQKSVRLIRAEAGEVRAVPMPDAPQSLEDFLRFEERQQDFQFRTGGQGGIISAGGPEEDRKNAQQRYLRAIAKAMQPRLNNSSLPLVFAGVEGLFGQIRESLAYPRLAPHPVPGNPDKLSAETLCERAQAVLEPLREAETAGQVAAFLRLTGVGRATASLEQVLSAAREGRVETLFLHPDLQRWGNVPEDGAKPAVHDQREPGDDELLDHAANWTLRTNGRVLPLPTALLSEVDIRDGVAAVLRY